MDECDADYIADCGGIMDPECTGYECDAYTEA